MRDVIPPKSITMALENTAAHVAFGAFTYYNERYAEVAQAVEQRTENPGAVLYD